ncbi:amidase signature domain-containing protein [Aspergillus oleicola]
MRASLVKIAAFSGLAAAHGISDVPFATECLWIKRSRSRRMHGIPFLYKDNIYTDDKHNTSEGALVLLGGRYSSEATVVTKKLPTIARCQITPPAGSSSGSMVAVRSNQIAIALGTETHGSLTHPSAQLGLYTIKSTPGLMSRHGIVTGSYYHDKPGPLARSMKDVAILLDIKTGPDPYDNPFSEIINSFGSSHLANIAPEYNHLIAFSTLMAVGYEMATWNDAHDVTTGFLGNGTLVGPQTGQNFYDKSVTTNGTMGSEFWTAFGWGRFKARQTIDSSYACTLENGTVIEFDGLLVPNGRGGGYDNACASVPSYTGYPIAAVLTGLDA